MIQLHQVDLNIHLNFFFDWFCLCLETYRCVKGQGMINMRTHDTGDLIIQFDVEFPTEKSLTPTQLKVIIKEILCAFFFLLWSFILAT